MVEAKWDHDWDAICEGWWYLKASCAARIQQNFPKNDGNRCFWRILFSICYKIHLNVTCNFEKPQTSQRFHTINLNHSLQPFASWELTIRMFTWIWQTLNTKTISIYCIQELRRFFPVFYEPSKKRVMHCLLAKLAGFQCNGHCLFAFYSNCRPYICCVFMGSRWLHLHCLRGAKMVTHFTLRSSFIVSIEALRSFISICWWYFVETC